MEMQGFRLQPIEQARASKARLAPTDTVYVYGDNAQSEIKSAAGVGYTYDGDGNRLDKRTLSGGQCAGVTKYYWYGAETEILDEMTVLPPR